MNALEKLKNIVSAIETQRHFYVDERSHPFIATHGPALVELIEAADWFIGRTTDYAALTRLITATRKLTEDKPG